MRSCLISQSAFPPAARGLRFPEPRLRGPCRAAAPLSTMMKTTARVFLASCLFAAGAPAQRRAAVIGVIDFYGYGSLDRARLHAALPFREGDAVPQPHLQEAARRAIAQIAGRPTAIDFVCCQPTGRWAGFIGIQEQNAPPLNWNAEPTGDIGLPNDVLKLFARIDKEGFAATRVGRSGEDDSNGYALGEDFAMRADQLKLRQWALANEPLIHRVLETSRDAGQRAYAAEALGYAERSPQQIQALVAAAFDAGGAVRNNATRALVVLCTAYPDTIRQVPVERFLPLLHSLVWTDRNKATALFLSLTASRDPQVLEALRAGALQPLREMAQWGDWDHAQMSVILLGRIAGMKDARVQTVLDNHDVAAVLDAVH
jgi:hypothetical protein